MGVTCQILINKPQKGVHKAGRPVTGVVKFTVDTPDRYKDITISLIGKGQCTWQEKRRVGNREETIHYIAKEDIIAQHLSIHERGDDGEIMLSKDTYERPFNFLLPYNIPSSFKSNTCTISYKLVLKFVKPSFFSFNKKFDTEIDVIGNVRPITPEGTSVTKLEKTLFKLFTTKKNRVYLETELTKTTFKPKEIIQLSYKITNASNVIIPSVKAELICHKTYTAGGKTIKRSKTIGECTVETASVPDNAVANLTSNMPLADYLYTIQHTKIMTNDYSIRVTLRLPMPHTNASINIPIVIGEKYGEDGIELYNPEEDNLVEEPPSYFQVMNTSKEKE